MSNRSKRTQSIQVEYEIDDECNKKQRASSSNDTIDSDDYLDCLIDSMNKNLENEEDSENEIYDDDDNENEQIPFIDNADTLSERKSYFRPPVVIEPEQQYIDFMQMGIDFSIHPNKGPTIRIYGTSKESNSVCADIHGFTPYFYMSAPPNVTPEMCEELKISMSKRLVSASSSSRNKITFDKAITNITIVKRESLLGYKYNVKTDALKIELYSPFDMTTFKKTFEHEYQLYEIKIPYILRFMADKDIVGCGWLSVPVSSIAKDQDTTCQIEARLHHSDLIVRGFENEWANIAPVRLLSFDIECAGRKGFFPVPEKDPVIQISTIVQELGSQDYIDKKIFTWRPSGVIHKTGIVVAKDEADMFVQWAKYNIDSDPDMYTGYNIDNFDWHYLMERAKILKVDALQHLGRKKNSISKTVSSTFTSAAFGTRESRCAAIDGRTQFDMFSAIQRSAKLRSFTLNNVAAHFLGEKKEDVHHSIITVLWNGTDDDRRRLASYCIQDAVLPLRLMNKLMCLVNNIEMARVTGVPFNYLTERGQTIKVISKLLRFCITEDLIIPDQKSTSNAKKVLPKDGVCFKGATVLNPKRGYYDFPIATLDFASLYPSIMLAHNLCHSTLINKAIALTMKPEDYTITPKEKTPSQKDMHGNEIGNLDIDGTENYFVKTHVRKGILPRILDDLLAARKRAKIDLANEKDPFRKAVFDGRQLALKLTSNSVYGFTGAARQGQLPCLEISAAVTAFGREMIFHTERLVLTTYCKANGYEFDSEVIYGDTDSVMIKFGTNNLAESMRLGLEASKMISATFIKPIQLEFEKCYFPYLLISKKRYAGVFWTKPDKYDKVDAKGIETVRRDNTLMVCESLKTILNFILLERNPKAAIAYAKYTIQSLLQGKIDLSKLIISKSISKPNYKAKQVHVELANRMRQRDPANAPSIGDRVPYVMIKGDDKRPAYERGEDPLIAMKERLCIDYNHYIEHQLKKPYGRIFKAIMKDPKDLFRGDHMLHKHIPVSANRTTGIGQFARIAETCMGCRVALPDGQRTLCDHCRTKAAPIYRNRLNQVREHERTFSSYWSQCQTCQGTIHQPIHCSNNACDIFYAREKAKLDLTDATNALQRFSLEF